MGQALPQVTASGASPKPSLFGLQGWGSLPPCCWLQGEPARPWGQAGGGRQGVLAAGQKVWALRVSTQHGWMGRTPARWPSAKLTQSARAPEEPLALGWEGNQDSKKGGAWGAQLRGLPAPRLTR